MSKNERHEVSAGILVYRIIDNEIQVLLGKNGGPRWKNKSVGSWNIPKGHVEDGENIFDTAIREFMEETSLDLNIESFDDVLYLDSSRTKSGKTVHIWALEYDYAPNEYKVEISSNIVETEWPPKSGNIIEVPELSEAYYFKINVAKRMIFPYQKIFLDKLENELNDIQSSSNNKLSINDELKVEDGECCGGGDAGISVDSVFGSGNSAGDSVIQNSHKDPNGPGITTHDMRAMYTLHLDPKRSKKYPVFKRKTVK